MSAINIPTIDENEYFVNIEESPRYYISNYKRIYNLDTNQFINLYSLYYEWNSY